MLEIFDNIGIGRSLLILGAPGSGKTTMLLELARQLIQRARQDVTEPTPMVFNLASWTEKFSLADWLAQELNNLYSVPRKTAPDWVEGNKLLLLLDGLDEIRQESRAKCVDAINEFRKTHGLTSLAVCSRSQDYEDLNTKLSFEGAIEVQPLTQDQVEEYIDRFGNRLAALRLTLQKDTALHEMAETPLFLSIMVMVYRDKQDADILVSQDETAQRNNLFDTYIERMFGYSRSKNNLDFKKQDVSHWLSWLAGRMMKHNQVPYLLESMQPDWFRRENQLKKYRLIGELIIGLIVGLSFGLSFGLIFGLGVGLIFGLGVALIFGLFFGLNFNEEDISTVDSLSFDWKKTRNGLGRGLSFGLIIGLMLWLNFGLSSGLIGFGLIFGLIGGLSFGLTEGLSAVQVDQTKYPGQRLVFTAKNFLAVSLIAGLSFGLIVGLIVELIVELIIELGVGLNFGLGVALIFGLFFGLGGGLKYGGLALIQHYTLRFILTRDNLLPWKLVPFLDHCVDLIFLRRVGGGYIFVHRLLMEHFAEMYAEMYKEI